MKSPVAIHPAIVTLGLSVLSVASPAQAAQFSFTGTTFGQWGLPADPRPGTLLTSQDGGINNRLEWGTSDATCPDCTPFNNYVQFDGSRFTTGLGTLFSLGKLQYRNASTLNGFEGAFPLRVSLLFESPTAQQQSFQFQFRVNNTLNLTGDPVLDGDRLTFTTADPEQTVTFGGTEYSLQLIGFSPDAGTSIVREFNAPEGAIENAFLFGLIKPAPTACPFP
jgi:hypothetical protein